MGFLFDRSPPGKPADRVIKSTDRTCTRIDRRRIERTHRDLVLGAGKMRKNFNNPMRFVVEVTATVGNDVVFVRVRGDRNTVSGFLKQIDSRSGIEAECFRFDRGCQSRILLVERKYNVNRFAAQLRHNLAQRVSLKPRNLRGKVKYSLNSSDPRNTRLSIGNSESCSSKPTCCTAPGGSLITTGSP